MTLLDENPTAQQAPPTPVAAPAPLTVLPSYEGPRDSTDTRRNIAKIGREEILTMIGAGVSSLATTALLFGRLLPLNGRLGFVVMAFLLYVAIYAFLVALTNDGPKVVDAIMTALMTAAAMTVIFALGSVVVYILYRGGSALRRVNMYTEDMSVTGPLEGLEQGGIVHAMVGTLIIISIALVITVPLGVMCAIYLNEIGGRVSNFVRSVVTAMTALPSILAGLFIFSTWILILGFPKSGFAASLAISIMMLPIIIRSADVVLRLVPGSLREASAATGAPQWRTVWHVVLPTARSGLVNSVILGVARGVGETAPVLLVSGVTGTTNLNPFENPMLSLPLATFEFVRSPQQTLIQRGFATAAVLMLLVLVLFALARMFGGRPAGHLSKRQTSRAVRQSARDLERIEASGGSA